VGDQRRDGNGFKIRGYRDYKSVPVRLMLNSYPHPLPTTGSVCYPNPLSTGLWHSTHKLSYYINIYTHTYTYIYIYIYIHTYIYTHARGYAGLRARVQHFYTHEKKPVRLKIKPVPTGTNSHQNSHSIWFLPAGTRIKCALCHP
jgi:hypothetical protein